jgi:2-dehydro-3-deoxygalactonokinase
LSSIPLIPYRQSVLSQTPVFLSCDWGTSSLRIRLTDLNRQQVLAETSSPKGIRDTFLLWREVANEDAMKKGGEDPAGRISFYKEILRESIQQMEGGLGVSLTGLPVVISGMASSSAGMLELPYAQTPFPIDGQHIVSEYLDTGHDFPHPILLISGVRSENDVMRGEETQLTGCAREDGLYIFPGTHSKHILVRDRLIVDFSTYMTGEFFGLLSEKSLLSGSVEKNDDLGEGRHLECFRRGVREAVGANLMKVAFQVRTHQLFGVLSRKENFHYLSGLLIGTELQAIAGAPGKIYLCCGAGMRDYYEKALAVLDLCERVHIFPAGWVDAAVVRGQCRIWGRCGKDFITGQ